ncbi:MAG: T9SS type A sorting domain-containing protein, partial [Bacteroidota bacterium]
LVEGSLIQNNVAYVAACFFRRPFQDLYQDGLHQFSFVEGGVIVRDNIMMVGNSLHQIRFKDPGMGRAFPDANKPVKIHNNYYGYSRSNATYVWQGDGITPYSIDSMYYGPISTPSTRDAYNNPSTWTSYYRVCNSNTPIHIQNSTYPAGRTFYNGACGPDQITGVQNTAANAPLVQFNNAGFSDGTDYRKITFWSAEYETSDKSGTFIPYAVGDYVFYYDNSGQTHFYECIQAHAANFPPPTSPTYWSEMDWNGSPLPPLDLRTLPGSFYEQKGIGLEYVVPSIFPVEWVRFEVAERNGQADLLWETIHEVNNDHFTIERSQDGRLFQPVGTLEATGGGVHRFTDQTVRTGRYHYRIRQTDLDGRYSHSEIREVFIKESEVRLQARIFPNPMQANIHIEIESVSSVPFEVSLFDLHGTRLKYAIMDKKSFQWDTEALPVGLYVLYIKQGEQSKQQMIQKLR